MSGCESEMFRWMNDSRASGGIAPLSSDGRILNIARSWSDRMAEIQSLEHNPNYGNQIFSAVPESRRAGENVGRTTGSNRGLYDGFMASSGHRAKIMGAEYSHAVVGCTVDAGGQLWVTMNFWGA